MLKITFQGKTYDLDIKDALEGLTGHESIMVEDYLGGWSRFRDPQNLTRSQIVMVWLAKKQAGEKATFDEIADVPGIGLGNAMDIEDTDGLDGQSPPDSTQRTTTAPRLAEQDGSLVPVPTSLSELAR